MNQLTLVLSPGIIIFFLAVFCLLIGIVLNKITYNWGPVFLLLAAILFCASIIFIGRDIFVGNFTYQAQLMDGRIVDAKNCSLVNENKVCEIYNENEKAVIEYVVEDYWEKTADTK